MAKETKVKNLKFDLDEKVETKPVVQDPDVPALQELKQETKTDNWDALMVPVKVFDDDGNSKHVLKPLESVTVDEFKDWMREVMPFGDELIEKFMGLKGPDGKPERNSFHNQRTRKEIFNAVIKMHEMRWVFGLGKDKIPKDLAIN
jgi:hypothetical protein